MAIFDKTQVKPLRYIILQSLLAVFFLTLILSLVEVITYTAIVVSLGASTLLVFAMPNFKVSQSRRLIGGHLSGLVVGIICYYLLTWTNGGRAPEYILWFFSALAVGLSMFLMAVTRTGHPPAASTALGLVIQPWSYHTVLFVILVAVCLAITVRLFKERLIDLF